ncbi:NACHT, LRR and PYD domains-containing protein 1a-like isoform X3 [Vanacampus margaritifer]
MASSLHSVYQILSELSFDTFQKLCRQLVSQGSLKEGTYSTREELLTDLTSSLGEDEARKAIVASLRVIGDPIEGVQGSAEGFSGLSGITGAISAFYGKYAKGFSIFSPVDRGSGLVGKRISAGLPSVSDFPFKITGSSAMGERGELGAAGLPSVSDFPFKITGSSAMGERGELGAAGHSSGQAAVEEVVDKEFTESPVLKRPQYVSRKLLFRLMNSLEEDHIMSSVDRSTIMSSNSDIRSMAFHLNYLVNLKGQAARRRMTSHLRLLEPQLYGCRLVDEYKDMLIDMVEDVDIIIHDLNARGVSVSDEIKAIHNPKEKMSKVIDNLKSVEQKQIFYTILREWMPYEIHTILVKMETESSLMEGDKYFEIVTVKWCTENATVAKDEWIKKEPEVSHDGDVTWYSFSSVPGKFECSVSGFRWICKDSLLSFKYRFGRWWDHDHTMESLQCMPAGPLLDITVTDGQFDEVYLPHWICTTANPTILEKFAVLHSDTDGVAVEKVFEVTPSHVKLPQPVFSVRGVLLRFWRKLGFPVPLKCKVLIYRTKKTFLTLHVYLIPNDSALEEELRKKAKEKGYESIDKPLPEGTLQMDDEFKVKSDDDGAEIGPDALTLTYESRDPNYFEVFIEQPRNTFTLKLENSAGTVWSCRIRQLDYSSGGDAVPELSTFDDELLRVRSDFIDRVSPEVINQLLDDLLGVCLNDGERKAITKGTKIPAHRARKLIDTVRKKGPEASGRIIFHLEQRDKTLHGLLGLPSASQLQVAKVHSEPSGT